MAKIKKEAKSLKTNVNVNGTSERAEVFMRIVVLIVTGIILSIWKILIQVLTIIHWIMVLFVGKRNKELADFCEYWNTEVYRFIRYLTFVTNERPFPFTEAQRISRFK